MPDEQQDDAVTLLDEPADPAGCELHYPAKVIGCRECEESDAL